MPVISLFKPCFGEEELEALRPIFKSGWIGLGPVTTAFEEKFGALVGSKHCIGLNSCTAALDLAMRLLGINHGDEVIVPTMTFVSSAHAVAYNLASPVFADVCPDTLCLDPADVAKRITRRTRAIIAVHFAGRPAKLDALREVAGRIPIVEDCAHAAGGYYKGQHVGSIGTLGCFSFHAVKNIAMGDGGALTTDDDELADRCMRLRWLGIDKNTWERSKIDEIYWWEYMVPEIGLKCHMNDIQAAIGLVQLGKLQAMNDRRRQIAVEYYRLLQDIPGLELPVDDDADHRSSWHIFHIKCDRRNQLASYLQSQSITTGVHYKPIHLYACYGNRPTLPVAETAFERILSLPMHPGLSDTDVQTVCNAVREFYGS
jgi:perosamine synthetase